MTRRDIRATPPVGAIVLIASVTPHTPSQFLSNHPAWNTFYR
jgi:hypothetical protein